MLSTGSGHLSANIEPTGVPSGVIIAFDFGEKRIGVAVGDTSVAQASPLDIVRNVHGRPDWAKVTQLVKEWNPVAFVVGLPESEDDSEQVIQQLTNAFCRRLKKKFLLPVFRSDERYSSIEASRLIAANRQKGRRKAHRGDTDKIAAALILQQWFAQTQSRNVISLTAR